MQRFGLYVCFATRLFWRGYLFSGFFEEPDTWIRIFFARIHPLTKKYLGYRLQTYIRTEMCVRSLCMLLHFSNPCTLLSRTITPSLIPFLPFRVSTFETRHLRENIPTFGLILFFFIQIGKNIISLLYRNLILLAKPTYKQ